jgi:hypothetical protein
MRRPIRRSQPLTEEQKQRIEHHLQRMKEAEELLKINQQKRKTEEGNMQVQNHIKMYGQQRWNVIASENNHFPTSIPIGAELRYGWGENWVYKPMNESMKTMYTTSPHDALGVDRDLAPGIVKQLEIHEKYGKKGWEPIIVIDKSNSESKGGKKTRRNRNLKKRKTTRKH